MHPQPLQICHWMAGFVLASTIDPESSSMLKCLSKGLSIFEIWASWTQSACWLTAKARSIPDISVNGKHSLLQRLFTRHDRWSWRQPWQWDGMRPSSRALWPDRLKRRRADYRGGVRNHGPEPNESAHTEALNRSRGTVHQSNVCAGVFFPDWFLLQAHDQNELPKPPEWIHSGQMGAKPIGFTAGPSRAMHMSCYAVGTLALLQMRHATL